MNTQLIWSSAKFGMGHAWSCMYDLMCGDDSWVKLSPKMEALFISKLSFMLVYLSVHESA